MKEDNSTAELPKGVIGRVRGVAGHADRVNKNHRLYPKDEYARVVNAFHARESHDAMLGELDHPDFFSGESLKATAMNITGLSLSAGTMIFDAEVLDTPAGKTLQALLDSGVPVNMSTRGNGELIYCCEEHMEGEDSRKHAGTRGQHNPHKVVDGYSLRGIDAVAHGADIGARITHVEREGIMATLTEQVPVEPTDKPPVAVNDIARLQASLESANSDMTVLQAASKAEREALQKALEEAQANVATIKAEYEANIAAIKQASDTAIAERDEAVATMNKIKVEEQTNALLGNLRPDVKAKIAEQLSSCQTPEEVTERWKSIETLLNGAGFDMAPAGQGRVDREAAGGLTPEQRVQRGLLGF